MVRQYVIDNNRSREKLGKLVNTITAEELNLVIYKEGLTIAAVLGHIAFWDERRLVLLKKWKQKGVTPSGITDDDVDPLNGALSPFLLAISPRQLAEMAINTAEALDSDLEGISSDTITSLEKLGDRHALNRAIHRKAHLDEIEAFLKANRGKK